MVQHDCSNNESEVNTLGIRKGTKLTDNPKSKMLRIRIDKRTEQKINTLREARGKSMSEVAREGIDKLYDELQK